MAGGLDMESVLSIYGSHDASVTFIDKNNELKVLEYERMVNQRYGAFTKSMSKRRGLGTTDKQRDIFLKYIRSESLAQSRSERGGEVIDIDAHVVANVHDEWQVEVKEEKNSLDLVGYYGVHSIIKAGKNLKLNCPLDGEYKIGDNWSETH